MFDLVIISAFDLVIVKGHEFSIVCLEAVMICSEQYTFPHLSQPAKPWWTLTRQYGGLDIVCGCDNGIKLNGTYRSQSCSLAPVRTRWSFLDDTAPAWLSLAAVNVQGLWGPGLPDTCHLALDIFTSATRVPLPHRPCDPAYLPKVPLLWQVSQLEQHISPSSRPKYRQRANQTS